jgi:hypothetical protein
LRPADATERGPICAKLGHALVQIGVNTGLEVVEVERRGEERFGRMIHHGRKERIFASSFTQYWDCLC